MKPGLTHKERAAVTAAETIWEVPVYCGARKVWRVLNLSTGTVYNYDDETQAEAIASIEEGAMRAAKIVRGTTLHEICAALTLWRATK